MKTAQEIMDIINSTPNNENLLFGIRTTVESREVGEQLERSNVWDDEEPTEYELNGTCAIGIERVGNDEWADDDDDVKIASIEKAIKLSNGYRGNHKYLIAGGTYEGGDDEGEWVISAYDRGWRVWGGAIVIACLD